MSKPPLEYRPPPRAVGAPKPKPAAPVPTEEEVMAAALADPDAQPLTAEFLATAVRREVFNPACPFCEVRRKKQAARMARYRSKKGPPK